MTPVSAARRRFAFVAIGAAILAAVTIPIADAPGAHGASGTRWSLAAAKAPISTSTPIGTSSSTPTITSAPLPTGSACTAGYVISHTWAGGFRAAVTVHNGGDTARGTWTVKWTFANGQRITALWDGVLNQSGSSVTVKNASYNGTIPLGGSTSFGFTGSWNGTNEVPATVTCS